MDLRATLIAILDDVLNLDGRAATFNDDTPLLGVLPELDSMAVVGVIAAMEEQLELTIADDEIDGSHFASFGSLLGFLENKVGS